MRTATGAILVLVTAATLAGCGTAAALPFGGPHPGGATTAQAIPGPPAGTRAEADALADLLLSRLRLPAGTRHLPPAPVPRYLREPASEPAAGDLLDDYRLYAVALPPGTLSGYLVAHVPAGMTSLGTGQASGPGEPTILDVDYLARPVPAGIYSAQVVLTMVTDGSSGSLLRADAQVIWYPSRSASEYVDPARYHLLTMDVTIYGQRVRTVHKVVTSQADIARLAEALDRSPAEPPVVFPCPLSFATYQLSLSVSQHSRPVVVVSANQIGCGGTAITVNGKSQPALDDGGTVAAAADQALGFTPKPAI